MISKICIEQRIHICYSPAGTWRSVLGETVPKAYGLCLRPPASDGTQTEGTVSPNMDWPRPVNNIFIFFLLRFSFTLQPVGVEVGCVRVDEARDHANQNKTSQHDF